MSEPTDAELTALSALTYAESSGEGIFRTLKNPPAPDHEVADRAIYDLAYALFSTVGFNRHDWGDPLRLTRQADDGSLVITTIRLPENWQELGEPEGERATSGKDDSSTDAKRGDD
jgi:hypothetical protein